MRIPLAPRRLFLTALRLPFLWASPTWDTETHLSETVWRAQHDEISKTISWLASLLAGSCLFCIIMLAAPDVSLVSSDAKIEVPVASITVSYSDFLFFAPVFLIALTLYLHVFIEHRLRLGTRLATDEAPLQPFVFNLARPSAELLSSFLFYGMAPAVLAYFVWKTIPRQDTPWLLLFAFLALSGLMLALRIRRFRADSLRHQRVLPIRLSLGILWGLFLACTVSLILLVPVTMQIVYRLAATPSGDYAAARSTSSWQESALTRIRSLQLFAAQLEKKNLSGFYAPYADMRKANFLETDLEGANLSHADLRNANLTDANLTGADLTYAHLEGANLQNARLDRADLRSTRMDDSTAIDVKWRRVACIVRGDKTAACLGRPDLTWTDLSGANLRGADLAGADMTGADLSRADLSNANLSGAKLRIVDLRSTILPASFDQAIHEGALLTDHQALASDSMGVDVYLLNRNSEACLEASAKPDDYALPTMEYPCSTISGRQRWSVRRLANGFFVLRAAVKNSDEQSACLDGTYSNAERAPIQMWQCNDDYDTQYWRVEPVFSEFVTFKKYDTRMCLHGTATREGRPTPYLSECDIRNHDQHWRLSFSVPVLTDSESFRLSRDRARRERQADLERTAQAYMGGSSGFGSGGTPYSRYGFSSYYYSRQSYPYGRR